MDHGPGSPWTQGAEAGICSSVLVSRMPGAPRTSFGSLIRTCLAGVLGGGRYLQRKLLPFFYSCPGTRFREGIRLFLDECAAVGRSEKSALYLYVNGFDPKRSRIPVQDHLKRGSSLATLTDAWLSTWGVDD